MKCALIFALGLLIGVLCGYAANARESYIPQDDPLPGFYQNQVVVDPLLGSKIVAPVYHPVVIKKCYDHMAIERIPCPEDRDYKPIKRVTVY